jgi:hypothetical protein
VLPLRRRTATFGETGRYLWGDGSLPLGRRIATFGETIGRSIFALTQTQL